MLEQPLFLREHATTYTLLHVFIIWKPEPMIKLQTQKATHSQRTKTKCVCVDHLHRCKTSLCLLCAFVVVPT